MGLLGPVISIWTLKEVYELIPDKSKASIKEGEPQDLSNMNV